MLVSVPVPFLRKDFGLNVAVFDVDDGDVAVPLLSPTSDVGSQRFPRPLGYLTFEWYLEDHTERIDRLVNLKGLIDHVVTEDKQEPFPKVLYPLESRSYDGIVHMNLIPGTPS